MASPGVDAPAAMPRSLTTGSFLSHDMTPRDPYNNDLGRSKTMYDPSQGPGVRDFRMRGYTSHQMMEEHKKTPTDYVSPPRKAAVPNPVTSLQDPGKSQTSTEFFEGKHTTPQQKVNVGTTITDRFTPADVAKLEKERSLYHQQELQRYIQEVKKTKQDAVVVADAEKRKDMEMLKTYDPWGKGSGGPRANNAIVSKARLDEEAAAQSTDDYAAVSFGKQGAGAPNRTNSGKVKAQYHVDSDTQMGNLYRGNLGADASTRYGPKDQARVRETLEEQARERNQKILEDKQKQAEEEMARSRIDPLSKMGQGVPALRQTKRNDPDKERKQHYAKSLQEQQLTQRQAREEAERDAAKPPEADYEPWGKGVGTIERDNSGKVVKRTPSQTLMVTEPTIVDLMGKPGGGAPSQQGTGRLSPQKTADTSADDVYDPFGKPGAGAPPRDAGQARRRKGDLDMVSQSPTGSYAARAQFLKEQKELMLQKQQATEAAKLADRQNTNNPEEFFKFGQGAANPKRDDEGNIMSQRRGNTDIIGMVLDQGGGLGRKQKTEQSGAWHQELEQQAQQKKQLEQKSKEEEIQREQSHVQAASSWQGKAGAGAPRRAANGEVHGRFGVDKEMHHDEIVDTAKVIPKEEKARYADELARNVREKTQLQESLKPNRDSSAEHMKKMASSFGRPGHGAPLRSNSGKVVTQHGKALASDTREYRMNAKPGRLIE